MRNRGKRRTNTRSISGGTLEGIEQGVRRRARRGSIEKAVIGTLALGGMLTVGMMAPKVLALMRRGHLDAVLPQNPTQRLRETLSRLKRKGLVEYEGRSGKRYPILTKKGEAYVHSIRLASLKISVPRRWDQRWRVVIFDIPHRRRAVRDSLRLTLKRLNFFHLQNSVWVHPYDCEEIISLLKLDSSLRTEVRYIVADAIEYDAPLRKYFGLPLD